MINATYLHLRAKVGCPENDKVCPGKYHSGHCTADRAELVTAGLGLPIQVQSELTEGPFCEAVTAVPRTPQQGSVRPALTMTPH